MSTANTKDLGKLSDDALIKAHVREAQGIYPNGISRTEAGRTMLAADADRRAGLAARALELWPTSGYEAVGRIASDLLRANAKEGAGARLIKIGRASCRDRVEV